MGVNTVTTQMLGDAATRVSRYLLMQFLINLVFGVAVDPVAAVPELTTASGGFSASYYGSSALDLVRATTNVQQEWRTPPLWGIAASAPYLHDGRATSLDEAIRLTVAP